MCPDSPGAPGPQPRLPPCLPETAACGGKAPGGAAVAAAAALALRPRREARWPGGGGGGRGAAPPFPRGGAGRPYCGAVCGVGGASSLQLPGARTTTSPSLPQPQRLAPPCSAPASRRAGRNRSLSEGDNRIYRREEFLKKVTKRERKCRNQSM